jgi:hypothetical protein
MFSYEIRINSFETILKKTHETLIESCESLMNPSFPHVQWLIFHGSQASDEEGRQKQAQQRQKAVEEAASNGAGGFEGKDTMWCHPSYPLVNEQFDIENGHL